VGNTTAHRVPSSSERREGVGALWLPAREKADLAFDHLLLIPSSQRREARGGALEQTLVLLFLAFDAMPRPGNRFQAFYLNLSLTGHAQAVSAVLEAFQGFAD
jgi:hypothetical protein